MDYSNPREVVLRVVSSTVSGDFDGNGDYACNDVDMLLAAIVAGANDPAFDLTGNGQVNRDDLDAWLAEAGAAELASGNPYLLGDADLSGTVDGSDFQAWNANKFRQDNGWCGADFNADGSTDGHDLLIWNEHKFQSADGTLASVTEPGPLTMLLAALLAGILRRRASQ